MKYYKIMNDNLKHRGMQYQIGLNTNIEPFNTIPYCGKGLFFTSVENIFGFMYHGCKIAEIEIPEGEQIVQIDNKFKAHRIIIKNVYDINVDTLSYLIQEGADIHTKNDELFQWASEFGKLDIIKFLVHQGMNPFANDNLALRSAAKNNQLEVAKYLLLRGANVHAARDLAIQCAAENGHFEMVKYLIKVGADAHADNDLAAKWAESNNFLELGRYLRNVKYSQVA